MGLSVASTGPDAGDHNRNFQVASTGVSWNTIAFAWVTAAFLCNFELYILMNEIKRPGNLSSIREILFDCLLAWCGEPSFNSVSQVFGSEHRL